MSRFKDHYGFRRDEVGLHNWRNAPFSRFAFQHTREIVPTALIGCGIERAEPPHAGEGSLAGKVVEINGASLAWQDFLTQSHSDVFVAMKSGRIVAEWTAPHADAANPHILFSITKSVTGLLLGILEDRGQIDMSAPVGEYIPEAKSAAFGTATIQQLADMRTSLKFDESYLNADGDYARYRRATGWNPVEAGQAAETMNELLVSIPQGEKPHGGPFEYASPNTDMLGLVVERASEQDYSSLLSQLVWQPIGAHENACMTLDAAGAPRGAGGMCATARDLARFAEIVRNGGVAEGGRVVSTRWIDDMLNGGDETAWRDGNFAEFFPKGRYRNAWYQTGYDSGAYCCIGIHGQWAYVDPKAEAVVVKLSSQPIPLDEALDQQCLAFFRQICAAL